MNCNMCGLGLIPTEEPKGICSKCESNLSPEEIQERKNAQLAHLKNIILSTEMTYPGDYERIEIIASEYVIGLNVFKDLFVSITDSVGGRSATMQKELSKAREYVLNDLKQQAFNISANAVIAIDIKYNELNGKNSQMLFVAATGTAIKT